MNEPFLVQESIKANKKSRKMLISALIFFVCIVSVLAFVLKDSFDLSDSRDGELLFYFILLAGVMLVSVIFGLIKSFIVARKGQNLKLPFNDRSREEAAEIINSEAAEGKLLIDEYIYDFSDGKKPYGEKVLLTPSYLMLTNGAGKITAIPRDKIYWLCAQAGIKGRSSFIVRFLVFTENGTFYVDGVDGKYVEALAEKFYQYIPNVFKDYDPFKLSYQLEATFAKNRPAFLAFYEEEKAKMMDTAENTMSLENQNGKLENIRDIDIEDYLSEMFGDIDQFVILAPKKAVNGIAFVQACQARDMINVQLGLEENGGTKLAETYCSQQECMDIFLQFYDFGTVENIERYTLVQRM